MTILPFVLITPGAGRHGRDFRVALHACTGYELVSWAHPSTLHRAVDSSVENFGELSITLAHHPLMKNLPACHVRRITRDGVQVYRATWRAGQHPVKHMDALREHLTSDGWVSAPTQDAIAWLNRKECAVLQWLDGDLTLTTCPDPAGYDSEVEAVVGCKLYYCADPDCDGRPFPASERPHMGCAR